MIGGFVIGAVLTLALFLILHATGILWDASEPAPAAPPVQTTQQQTRGNELTPTAESASEAAPATAGSPSADSVPAAPLQSANESGRTG